MHHIEESDFDEQDSVVVLPEDDDEHEVITISVQTCSILNCPTCNDTI